RGSHYPHHTEFAKECDRQGILFWSENVFWGIGGFKDEGYWDSSAMPTKKEDYLSFENSLKQSLREMIRTNRNSPSIICWSMGNEIFFSKKQVISDARKMVKRLVDYCHSIDDTRPAGIGGVQRGDFDKIGDVAGYNGDGAVLFKNPEKPNMV
ncbi:MAG: glycoside hydrolase family 2 TIM barrel-domain containing protein, partial [Oscillospiraceae bacterium]